MTTFERRQRILTLLREQAGVNVVELARLLDVSEGTVRNDLNALADDGQLVRVRGGAVPVDTPPHHNLAFAARAQTNAAVKQRIARWAADMIEEGDSILLDASTTVYHIAPFLKNVRNLTIITNGIEIGLTLAKNPNHTVILIGGVLRSDGVSVVGHLGEKILEGLHIKTAFVSCSGFSVEVGLTDVDLQETQLKSKMIRSAGRVVALIDSGKFGQVGLTPFATVDQVSHIFTDKAIEPKYIDQLRQTCAVLTVCGENTVTSFTPCNQENTHYKIGFANLDERIPFCVDVRRGMEQAVQNAGNIDLIVGDNRMSSEAAMTVADRFVAEGVDLAIEYQIDEKLSGSIAEKFHRANIPVIAVDIPMVGATFFGVDNYRAGHMAGAALGRWIQEEWQGRFDRLIVLEEPRAGALPAARIRGQLDGLQEAVGQISQSRIIYLDSGNRTETSQTEVLQALKNLPEYHRLAVISFNDDTALGALAAARAAGREADVVIVGQGADRWFREEIVHPDSRLIGSTAYWPERYGEKLIKLALDILSGKQVPPAIYADHVFINAENVAKFYPE